MFSSIIDRFWDIHSAEKNRTLKIMLYYDSKPIFLAVRPYTLSGFLGFMKAMQTHPNLLLAKMLSYSPIKSLSLLDVIKWAPQVV